MELDFANPAAFWLLLSIPVLIVLKVLGDARARRSVGQFASPRLLDGLLYSTGRGRSWVVISLELLAIAFFAAALARPQYGVISEESKGSGRSLILAIDTSKSMLANDVLPSRLERAQMAAEDLVKRLRTDRIGLMPFAGSAFMYAPITPDADAVMESIQSIDTDIIPRAGSNLAQAIDLAIATFKKADLSGQQAMVIFSDGEELEGEAIAAAKRAREAKLAIICVGVGKAEGGLIPNPLAPGGFQRDRDNKFVTTRLKKEVLTQIAAITGGLYLSLDGAGISDSRIDIILSKLHRSAMKSKTIETAVDRYRWPLCAGLISLTAAFITGIVRRHRGTMPASGTTVLAALAVVFFAGPHTAQAQEDLLPPPVLDEAGEKPSEKLVEAKAGDKPEPEPLTGDPWKFYKEGDWRNSVFNFSRVATKAPEDELDRLQIARGVAAYKAALANSEKFDSGMMEQAMDAFGVALSSDDLRIRSRAHYNLANAVFERAKAAEKQRVINLSKAKSKKQQKKYQITLKYLDTVIRQCENSVEHYQETIILQPDNKDARKNHDEVVKFIEKLRDIRQQKASEQQAKKGEGEDEGDSEGEGEGECPSKSKSKGKGKGKGQGEGEGEGDEEGEGGDGDKEGPDPGEGSGDKANEEFKGKAGADGDTDADGEGGDKEEGKGGKEGENEGEGEEGDGGDSPGSSEIGRGNSIRTLKNLSQELKTKPRNQSAHERDPVKNW